MLAVSCHVAIGQQFFQGQGGNQFNPGGNNGGGQFNSFGGGNQQFPPVFAGARPAPAQNNPPNNFFNQPRPAPAAPVFVNRQPAGRSNFGGPGAGGVTPDPSQYRWTGPTEAPYVLAPGQDTPAVQQAKEDFYKKYTQALSLATKLGFDGNGGKAGPNDIHQDGPSGPRQGNSIGGFPQGNPGGFRPSPGGFNQGRPQNFNPGPPPQNFNAGPPRNFNSGPPQNFNPGPPPPRFNNPPPRFN